MSRRHRSGVIWRLSYKKLHCTWRHPCDFSAMSHLGRRQSTWRLSYKNDILVKMRCRGDIAGGSLGDFYIKLCISLGDLHAMSQWRRTHASWRLLYERTYILRKSRGDLAATQAQSPRMLACHTEDIYKPHLPPYHTVVQWSNAYSISSEMRARRLLVCLV